MLNTEGRWGFYDFCLCFFGFRWIWRIHLLYIAVVIFTFERASPCGTRKSIPVVRRSNTSFHSGICRWRASQHSCRNRRKGRMIFSHQDHPNFLRYHLSSLSILAQWEFCLQIQFGHHSEGKLRSDPRLCDTLRNSQSHHQPFPLNCITDGRIRNGDSSY